MSDNPYLDSVPEELSKADFVQQIKSTPDFAGVPMTNRIAKLGELFVPMDYMYTVYDLLLRAIRTTYLTITMLDTIRQIQGLRQESVASFATEAESGSILGVPGVGKSSTVRRCLSLIPQCVTHSEYNGKPFYKKQILHLFVECPSDCSVKTLAYSIIAAVDRAIGSEYFRFAAKQSRLSASALVTQVKIICLNHAVGVIVVDEIQNAIQTAVHNKQVRPLIKFLVELVNETCTSIYFIGTSEAEQLFCQQEHLQRRTRGLRLLPLRPDAGYRQFLEQIWQFQITETYMPLTDRVANLIYDHSGGIPSYIMQIFQQGQAQTIQAGREQMDEKLLKQGIELLNLSVPKKFPTGISLSDFTVSEVASEPAALPEQSRQDELTQGKPQEVPRLYANPRGRKAVSRNNLDLIELWKRKQETEKIVQGMENLGLIERGLP